jgi:hypothetical protein
LARATVKYGNVYLLARRFNSSRSCVVRMILYGLLRGSWRPPKQQHSRKAASRRKYVIVFME